MKSVIVAISNTVLANWVTSVLHRGGYSIEYTCKTAGDVTRVAEFCTSMTIVSGFQFPDMTAEDLMSQLGGRLAMVTILLPHQRDLVSRTDMSTIPYPMNPVDLLESIEETERKAARDVITGKITIAGKETRKERPAEEKLLILKAKNSIMERFQMTESQAHRFLQKTCMDRGLKLVDAARKILDNSLVL